MPIGPIVGGLLLTHFWWGSVFLVNVPVVVLALIAVAVLLPESRSAARLRLDMVGVVISSVGLAALTYGAIEAGQKGWGGAAPVSAMVAGLVVLATFVLWERHVSRGNGRPLIDLTLFRSGSFTWGTILGTIVTFAIFGVSFTWPQYFQMIVGTDALGSGLRSLPMVGGLLVGSQVGNRLLPRLGAKLVAAAGFALMACGLTVSATTHVGTGYGVLAIGITVMGAGLGLALPAAMFGAMSTLSKERSGAGTALIMAIRQVGGTIGVAVLGTILASTYTAHLDVTGLPWQAAQAARQSVAAGVAVARQVGSARLRRSVFTSFVSGMDNLLWVCAGIALLGVVLAVLFLPRRPGAGAGGAAPQGHDAQAS